ncbi:hypothetical protein GLE_1999 [Lysobacter enzymogenes]|uniref:Uncharacterized protein n=1 Tax=Lysobacter enzymogenes TaxID=69 RepID=A0A0S2DFJ0_LYSEN|nr:hypothetical protein GLE_1999 [Lysobacter enzymogenes]
MSICFAGWLIEAKLNVCPPESRADPLLCKLSAGNGFRSKVAASPDAILF